MKILRRGDKGPDVGVLQTHINKFGYYLEVDEEFGELTENALLDFQEEQNLVADGIAGPRTWEKLIGGDETKDAASASAAKGTPRRYEYEFNRLTVDPGKESSVNRAADRVVNDRKRYELTAHAFKNSLPWYFIAGLHNQEASGNFAGVLHNGERILGTGRKTRLVPAGRGPFQTWEEAAVDALLLKGFDKITDWSLGNLMRLAERYNGTGVLMYHPNENTAYLYAMSNVNDGTGKYVADGKWSETASADGQVGMATLLKTLENRGVISIPRAFRKA